MTLFWLRALSLSFLKKGFRADYFKTKDVLHSLQKYFSVCGEQNVKALDMSDQLQNIDHTPNSFQGKSSKLISEGYNLQKHLKSK